MVSINAVLTLIPEQINQVTLWTKALPLPVETSKYTPNGYWFKPEGADERSVIIIGENIVQIQSDITEEMYKGETIFGLSKDVFNNVIKTQKWEEKKDRSVHCAKIPIDRNNFVDIDWGVEHSSEKKREWYETEKIWKDRVYTVDLLCERLAGSLTRRYETLEDGLNYASSGLFEHHEPISIRMIIEHLNDESTTEMVKDLLLDTVNENKVRIERIREFKRKCAKINE